MYCRMLSLTSDEYWQHDQIVSHRREATGDALQHRARSRFIIISVGSIRLHIHVETFGLTLEM